MSPVVQRLQVEELSARTLPSATVIDPPDTPDTPAHVGHAGVHATHVTFDGLDGTVRGTLTPVVHGPTDGGLRYAVAGSGKLGGLDTFHVTGSLHAVGFIANGHAAGDLTLTNAHGTITMHLVGPQQPGFSPLPGHFHFVVTGGTGAYTHLQDDGEVTLVTQQHGGTTSLRLVFA